MPPPLFRFPSASRTRLLLPSSLRRTLTTSPNPTQDSTTTNTTHKPYNMITNKQTTHKPTSGLASILPSLEVNTAPAATPSTTSSYRIRREPPLSNRERASEVMLRFGPPPSATTTSGDLGLEEFTQREIDQSKYWFKHGDTYAPNDLTMEELRTRRLRGRRPVRDAFDVLGLNPLSQYKVFQPPCLPFHLSAPQNIILWHGIVEIRAYNVLELQSSLGICNIYGTYHAFKRYRITTGKPA
jgi:hypothetical protein